MVIALNASEYRPNAASHSSLLSTPHQFGEGLPLEFEPIFTSSKHRHKGLMLKSQANKRNTLHKRKRLVILRDQWLNFAEAGDLLPDALVHEHSLPSIEPSSRRIHPAYISPPLPPRRIQPARSFKRPKAAISKQDKDGVHTKPYVLEVPKTAPYTKDQARLDFYPWEGNQPEDVLNEHTVKSGHYDKNPVSSNETGSARPLIWPSVKHKSGLQVLSSLFISSLEQRLVHSAIKSKSTFKPPPRVTLTDAKREAWLKDLADPNIPLRRLSRTIPHGVRGKMLLDHCQAKNVPTWRAIWLAKCVGANEIRASKRKGTSGAFAFGGEAKWIRDWTLHLQQFLETLMESCGSDNWKDHMTYGLCLVAHIYYDHLIDRETFIEWITNGVRITNESNLPSWILLVKTYWPDIVATRRRGRSLTIALTEALLQLRHSGDVRTISGPFVDLVFLLQQLTLRHPGCLIIPNHWSRYREALEECFSTAQGFFNSLPMRVLARIEQFQIDPETGADLNQVPYEDVITALNSTFTCFDIALISKSCQRLSHNNATLVQVVLQWASTKFRGGVSRVYVAVRLLRRWARSGMSLDSPITSLLGESQTITNLNIPRLYLLLAELVRSGHFSVGRYLQWLLAKGPDASLSRHRLDLLDNIPLSNLPENVLNLRLIVLSKFSRISAASEESDDAKAILATKIPFVNFQGPISNKALRVQDICGSAKYDTSLWIRRNVTQHAQLGETDKANLSADPATFTVADFRATISSLESLSDYSVMADVLHTFIERLNFTFIRYAVDFMNLRFDILYAIGAMEPLFSSLIARVTAVVPRTTNEKPLFRSLITLASRLPRTKQTLSKLHEELGLCEPCILPVACSPVSENMIEVLQTRDLILTAEAAEQILSSGTALDQVSFNTVFSHLIQNLETVWYDTKQMDIDTLEMIGRLRTHNSNYFESLSITWLTNLYVSRNSLMLNNLIPFLVSFEIFSIELAVSILLDISDTSEGALNTYLVSLLDLIFHDPIVTDMSFKGKFEAERQSFIATSSTCLILVARVIHLSSENWNGHEEALAIIEGQPFLDFLQARFSEFRSDGGAMDAVLSAIAGNSRVLGVIDAILGLKNPDLLNINGFCELFHLADEFNAELCRIRLLAATYGAQQVPVREFDEELVTIFVEEVGKSFKDRQRVWHQLLPALPVSISNQMYQALISALFRQLEELDSDSISLEIPVGKTTNLLAAVEVTGGLASTQVSEANFEEIALRISDLYHEKVLYRADSTTKYHSREQVSSSYVSRTAECFKIQLEISLHLIAINRKSVESQNTSQVTLCRLSVILCLTLARAKECLSAALTDHLFDTISILSDSLTQESRHYCLQILRDQHECWRFEVTFFFGTPPDDHDSLDILNHDPASNSTRHNTAADAASQVVTYPLRKWEMVQDATPLVGENDTSVNLILFGAKKIVTSTQN